MSELRKSTDIFKCSLRELAEMEIEDSAWVVEPFVPTGGQMMVYSDTGFGKTMVAMAMAHAVVTGTPFLGEFETTQGNVIFLQADMPLTEWRDRARSNVKAILPPASDRIQQIYYGTALDVIKEADKGDNSWLKESILEEDPIFNVIDVVGKTHRLDPNVGTNAKLVQDAWREICGHKPALCYQHHENKAIEAKSGKAHSSGAHEWLDHCSSAIRVVERKGQVVLVNTKSGRNAGKVSDIVVVRDPETKLIQRVGNQAEVKMLEMMHQGAKKTAIVQTVSNKQLFGKDAIPVRTLYDRLKKANYEH